ILRGMPLKTHFPATLLVGCLGLVAGSLISVTFWLRLIQGRWTEPIVSPFDEPLINLMIGWMVVPWGFGLELGWFLAGDGIVPFLGGAVAMGLFYFSLGFLIDLCIKIIRFVTSAFAARKNRRLVDNR